MSLTMLGRADEATPFIDEAWSLDGGTSPERFIDLFAYTGDVEESRKILTNSNFHLTDHDSLARGYLALGEIDNCFKSIQAGIDDQHEYLIDSLTVAEWWNPIRDDPRFDEMLELLDSKVTHTEQYLRDNEIEQRDQ